MPAVGVGPDLLVGEGVELVAHRLQRLVQSAPFQRRPAARLLQQLDDADLDRLRRAGTQAAQDVAHPFGGGEDVGGPEDLTLVHRDAADHLAQILVRQKLGRQGLGLAEIGSQRAGPGGDLAQGLGIGRAPGQAVGGVLLVVDQRPVQAAVAGHPAGDGGLQGADQGAGLEGRGVEDFGEVGQDEAHGRNL